MQTSDWVTEAYNWFESCHRTVASATTSILIHQHQPPTNSNNYSRSTITKHRFGEKKNENEHDDNDKVIDNDDTDVMEPSNNTTNIQQQQQEKDDNEENNKRLLLRLQQQFHLYDTDTVLTDDFVYNKLLHNEYSGLYNTNLLNWQCNDYELYEQERGWKPLLRKQQYFPYNVPNHRLLTMIRRNL